LFGWKLGVKRGVLRKKSFSRGGGIRGGLKRLVRKTRKRGKWKGPILKKAKKGGGGGG